MQYDTSACVDSLPFKAIAALEILNLLTFRCFNVPVTAWVVCRKILGSFLVVLFSISVEMNKTAKTKSE